MSRAIDQSSVGNLMDLIASLGRSADPRETLGALTTAISPTPAYIELSTFRNNREYVIRRWQHDSATEQADSPPAGRLGGGFLGKLIRSPEPKSLSYIDLTNDPVLSPEFQDYRSAIAAPLFVDQNSQDWAILLRRDAEAFDSRDLETLIVRTSLVSAAATNLQITRQLFEANLKSQQEITEIAEIQQAILPAELPTIEGLSLAIDYQPAGQAGGDLYDFVALGPADLPSAKQRWAILIADVSGHGAAAAVVMAMLHSILHTFPRQPAGPAEVLSHANRHLCEKRIGRAVTTAFLGFYDPALKTLTYARAGHEPPLVISHENRRTQYLDAVGDLPLGISVDTGFSESALQLSAGESIVLYTDGVVESRNPAGQMFDIERLESAAASTAGMGPNGIIRQIREAVLTHCDGTPAADDQTIVALNIV